MTKFALVLAALFAVSGFVQNASAAKPPQADRGSADLAFLRVDLPDGKTWVLGEGGVGRPFMAQLVLHNQGTAAVTIWDYKNSEGAESPGVVLTDAKGHDTLLRAPPIARAAGFPTVITIQPHGVVVIDLELLRLVGEHGLPPGPYKLKGFYENKLKNDTGFIKATVWTGRIESEPETITIAVPKLPTATSAKTPATNTTIGQIEGIEGHVLTLHVFRGHSGILSKMNIDEQTTVLIDGKQGKLADLKVGHWIKVTRDADWKKVLKIEPTASLWEKRAGK